MGKDFYTSDDPVIAIKDKSGKKIEEIWFPFTSSLCIRIHGKQKGFQSGELFQVSDDNTDKVNRMIIINSKREFYSNHRLALHKCGKELNRWNICYLKKKRAI